MSMSQKVIVIVEDEDDIREIVAYNLRREGFDVLEAATGEAGFDLVVDNKPDLVLLDLMLPGIDGLEVCQKIKNHEVVSNTAVILVTAKGEESDIVLGLGMGADDYVCKPFSPKELIARVKAVLRRSDQSKQGAAPVVIECDQLSIDNTKHKVCVAGQEIPLTSTEFKILYFLASKPGRVFTREQIINYAISDRVVIVDRNMDVHIRAIRKKLGDSTVKEVSEYIETVRGIGYRFKE